jgi:phospholipid/cholesterol/gamma-HCH transport system substrate-binding protein
VIKLHPNVRRQIQYVWIIGGFVILAAAVALYIARQERLRFPWEPVMHIEAQFSSGQAVMPGQGQQVTIAGVKIGEIGAVRLKDGRALIRMDIDPRKSGPIYRNLHLLLRPKTGLNDMSIQVDPGTPDQSLPDGGQLHDGDTVPESATQPNVNPDEVFAGLDADSRRYLSILANAGGQGFDGRGVDLRRMIEAGYPTLRDASVLTKALADRRAKVARLVSNLRKLSHAAAGKDGELTQLVRATSAVVTTIGSREAKLGAAVDKLPGALGATRDALTQTRALATELRPAAQTLRPMARELGPALVAARPLLRDATPALRNHVRPLVRQATPLVRDLRPAVANVNRSLPSLIAAGKDANYIVNETLYNPPGPEEGFGFWASWFFHNADSILSVEDAHGAVWRGLVVVGCSSLAQVVAATPALAPLKDAALCPKTAGQASSSASVPVASRPNASTPALAHTLRALERIAPKLKSATDAVGAIKP